MFIISSKNFLYLIMVIDLNIKSLSIFKIAFNNILGNFSWILDKNFLSS